LETANLGSSFDGESKKFGFLLARLANEIKTSSKSSVFILGGETTIKLNRRRKNGVGGRNQEAILVAALNSNFHRKDDITIVSMGTDGIDGNSKAAGAFATQKTVALIKQNETEMMKRLYSHSSYNVLRTGTNLNDISIVSRLS
jgi:glycerate 2-kinase